MFVPHKLTYMLTAQTSMGLSLSLHLVVVARPHCERPHCERDFSPSNLSLHAEIGCIWSQSMPYVVPKKVSIRHLFVTSTTASRLAQSGIRISWSWTIPGYLEQSQDILNNPRLSWTTPGYLEQSQDILNNPRLSWTIPGYLEQSQVILNNPRISWIIPGYLEQSQGIQYNPRISWTIPGYFEQSQDI